MKTDPFVHLHVHSHYSLLDGACKTEELISTATKNGMDSLALTDHGNLFGAIEFYKMATAAGIKPIIGCEAYLALGSRLAREGRGGAYYHITLLVQNEQGYKNLMKLSSASYQDGFYYKPRIDLELLKEYHEGLIALSGCMKGPANQRLMKDDYEGAVGALRNLRDLFGEDHLYVELMDNGIAQQQKLNTGLLQIARELSIPPVATNDIHYIAQDDSFAHDCLICIGHGKTVDDTNRLKYPTDQFYFKSGDEMRAIFEAVPEAASNTRTIADRCNLEIRFGERHLPKFIGAPGKSNSDLFHELCEAGAREKLGEELTEVQRERLDREMGVIERMGYISYFLIVRDFVIYAREQEIPVGYRGSCGASLVAYVLGITTIDPLKYDILFERFLDEERKEAPDFDIDLCMHRREEVIQYVIDKYGSDKLAQIITFGKLKAKAVIRDVGRVLDIPLSQVDRVAKEIPGGPGVHLAEAIEASDELKTIRDSDPRMALWFKTALRLEGTCRHAGTHAAGVVITDKPLTEYVPLARTGGEITTQFDMSAVDAIGLLKIDFLGLRTLTVIDTAVREIERNHGLKVDVDNLPLDDPKTFKLFCQGDTRGVFQFESAGFRDLLKKLRPDRMEHLIVANALYRPAAIQAGVIDDFIAARHGRKKVEFKHPILKDVLESTHGVMAYQGQVMMILHRLGGLTMAQALTLVKAISKKKRNMIASMKDQFLAGARKSGVSKALAAEIFGLVEFFGGYGFNKAHAAAYAMVAYKTAYLKAHYPVEFMAALLTSEIGDSDKILGYINDCKQMRIKVIPPAVNESFAHFAVTDGAIRFGLAAVKNVGEKTVEALVAEREKGGVYTDLFDFCERVEAPTWNRAALESLIKCGAFDCTGWTRAGAVTALDSAMAQGTQTQRDRRAGQKMLFGEASGTKAPKVEPPAVGEWEQGELLKYEKESLGLYCSSHPLEMVRGPLRRLSTHSSQQLQTATEDQVIRLGCMITQCRVRPTKKGDRMAWLSVEDLDGPAEGVIFPRTFKKYDGKLAVGQIVILTGKVDTGRELPVVLVDKVTPIEEIDLTQTRSVTVQIDQADLDSGVLDALRELFGAHPGPCPGVLVIDAADGRQYTVAIGSDLSVDPSETFASAVEGLMGEGKLSFC